MARVRSTVSRVRIGAVGLGLILAACGGTPAAGERPGGDDEGPAAGGRGGGAAPATPVGGGGAAMAGTPAGGAAGAPGNSAVMTGPGSAPVAIGDEFKCGGKGQDPGPALVRRLTADEYLNSVQDLLGVDARPLATKLPTDSVQEGFTNDTYAQTVSLDHVETWAEIAAGVVARLPERARFVARHASCQDLTEACLHGFIDKLGTRILRRPPSMAEKAAFAPVLAAIKADGGTFEEAALLVTEGLLQSPRFLYRIEAQVGPSGTRKVDDWELASRLSFLLWSAAPDDALLDAARAGMLGTDAQLGAQIDRMLASERARRSGRAFLEGWLNLHRLHDLASPLAADMRAETEAVFDRIVWDDRKPLTALLDAPFTIASRALATHYKLPAPKTGVATYDLSAVPQRRGLLTHATVLSAGGEDASLVNRGLFLVTNLLCSEVPPPPVGVNNGRPDTLPGKTQRQYAEERIAADTCGACHKHMDPLAYPFEAFTGLGVFRDKDEKGNAIDTTGRFTTPYDREGKDFKDAASFIVLAAKDERVRDCMLLKTAQFALGRALDAADACTLTAARTALAEGGVTFTGALKQLALQPSFRLARVQN